VAQGQIDIGAYEAQNSLNSYVVDTIDDFNDRIFSPGNLSLREAIELSNITFGTQVITFDPALTGQTIVLGLGPLLITDSTSIIGLGADQLTISGNNTSQIFRVDDGSETSIQNVEISELTLTAGNASTGFGTYRSGGAIWSDESLTITNATIVNNQADGAGGGIATGFGTLSVIGSTISGNSAQLFGGGIQSLAPLLMLNSTVSGNSSADGGGGIVLFNGGSIAHSTITGNTAQGGQQFSGGGMLVINGLLTPNPNFQLDLINSIVAGNLDSSGPAPDVDNVVISDDVNIVARFSLIGDATGANVTDNGGNQIGSAGSPINPLLGPLNNNGGPTDTHALLAGSPAIDMGDTIFDPNAFSPPLDNGQRGAGFARVSNGRIDIGAFEAQAAPVAANADFNGDLDVDGADFLAWQRGFGTTSGATLEEGDANVDGAVDEVDLLVWQGQFGQTPPPAFSTIASSSIDIVAASATTQETRYLAPTLQHIVAVKPVVPFTVGNPIALEARDAALALTFAQRPLRQVEHEAVSEDFVIQDFHRPFAVETIDGRPRFRTAPVGQAGKLRTVEMEDSDERELRENVTEAVFADIFS